MSAGSPDQGSRSPRDRPRPGVHRVLGEPTELISTLRRDGWLIGRLGPATDRRELLAEIGETLHFPDYYGRNLDALDECLRDLDRPTALVWSGWQQLVRTDPRAWSALLEIFDERAREHPDFTVFLV